MTTQTAKRRTVVIRSRTLGEIEITPSWCGKNLAVHRSVLADDNGGSWHYATGPHCWTITHLSTGYSATGRSLGVTRAATVALAKAWDDRFGDITEAGNARGWRYARTWGEDLRRVLDGKPPEGPVLPDFPNSADVARAMEAALGGGAPAADDSGDPGEQFPALITRRQSGHGAVRRAQDGTLEFYWVPHKRYGRIGWYPVPSMAEMELWTFDSVAESPDGERVEPDAPDSWLSLLGVI